MSLRWWRGHVPTLAALRRYAIGRSLFGPTTLGRAIAKLGFVQTGQRNGYYRRAGAAAEDAIVMRRALPR